MELNEKVAIVTGGGGGIGGALARELVARGARVAMADVDRQRVEAVAAAIEAETPGRTIGAAVDITSEKEIEGLVAQAEEAFGPVDLYFANAGIGGSENLSNEEDWFATIDVNLMAHVRAARVLVPSWLERGSGYFVSTASAAGLLTQVGAAPYTVTKHAAVAFSEWLSVTYGGRGVRVSCLCPMGVATAMFDAGLEAGGAGAVGAEVVAAAGDVLPPEQVAETVMEGVIAERFLILPHPEVLEFFRRKGSDYDRWLAGMRRLQARVEGAS